MPRPLPLLFSPMIETRPRVEKTPRPSSYMQKIDPRDFENWDEVEAAPALPKAKPISKRKRKPKAKPVLKRKRKPKAKRSPLQHRLHRVLDTPKPKSPTQAQLNSTYECRRCTWEGSYHQLTRKACPCCGTQIRRKSNPKC